MFGDEEGGHGDYFQAKYTQMLFYLLLSNPQWKKKPWVDTQIIHRKIIN